MGSLEKTFQRLVAQLDYPIFIATVAADGERIVERVEFGDHLGIVLEPFYAEEDETCGQLGFHRAKRIDPGHEA